MINLKNRDENEEVLNTAHENYEKGMNSYAFFKINSKEASRDLVQDTFIKTWNYIINRGEIKRMKSFLYHILNQLIIDEYRKNKRRSVSLDLMVEKGFDPAFDDLDSRLNFIDGRFAMSLVKNLPFKYQQIINMKYNQGLSLKEMSSATGQSRNTITMQIHRGLDRLRKLYNRN